MFNRAEPSDFGGSGRQCYDKVFIPSIPYTHTLGFLASINCGVIVTIISLPSVLPRIAYYYDYLLLSAAHLPPLCQQRLTQLLMVGTCFSWGTLDTAAIG
jgi:hypothetical protein